jgi:murein DD-endopeptidase MepM/ murein hydrolase activator NlpD
LQSDIRAIGTQQPVPAVAPPSELVASAPIGSENYQPLLSAVLERSFSTELAPPKFDNLLPNGGSVFQGYVWPAQGVLSSGFGWRWGRMHKGIDIAAPIGTPVVAAAPGVITYSGWNEGGYGNLVEITHPDGSVTLYAHNHRVLVSLGQRVNQGQQVAEMGSTGRSTGPHLHFEIHPAGSGAANPMAYLPRGGRES